ncbi:MAG: tRNA dimethylallyltransferase, partial [Terricaulis sp.]
PALHAELAALDRPTAARLEPNDAPRIIRALEVIETTGESITSFQSNTKPALAANEWRGVALTPDRDALYASINTRFDKMLEQGALDEVSAFSARNLDQTLPAIKAHGAPALGAYLRGEMSLSAATEIGQRDTRRYAKRQFTWIANQMPDWPRIAPPELSRRTEMTLAVLAKE